MSRPSHWLSLWFLALGLGMWSLETLDRAAREQGRTAPIVLEHSGRTALVPVGAVFEGWVVDRLGWPVEGATVGNGAGAQVTSDVQGRFRLELQGKGQQQLRAQAAGYGPAFARGLSGDSMLLVLGQALPWTGIPQTVAPKTVPEPANLLAGEGELIDAEGREIAGGRVYVLETGDAVAADEFGRFRLPLLAGVSHLLAYDFQGRVGEMSFEPSRTQGVLPLGQIALREGLNLVGVLRSSENEPCAEAVLQLRFAGMQRQLRTDAAGRFAFRGLVAGDYVLTAYPHRGDLGFRESITLTSNHDADWMLESARKLQIQVTSELQLPRGLVHVVAADANQRSAYARADEAGRVSLDGLGEGPYDFAVRDPDLSELDVLGYDEGLGRLIVGDGISSPKER